MASETQYAAKVRVVAGLMAEKKADEEYLDAIRRGDMEYVKKQPYRARDKQIVYRVEEQGDYVMVLRVTPFTAACLLESHTAITAMASSRRRSERADQYSTTTFLLLSPLYGVPRVSPHIFHLLAELNVLNLQSWCLYEFQVDKEPILVLLEAPRDYAHQVLLHLLFAGCFDDAENNKLMDTTPVFHALCDAIMSLCDEARHCAAMRVPEVFYKAYQNEYTEKLLQWKRDAVAYTKLLFFAAFSEAKQ